MRYSWKRSMLLPRSEELRMHGAPDPVRSAHLQALQQEVAERCPGVPPQLLEECFGQLDPDYFALFTAAQIADHVTLLAAIDDQHPVQVRITPRSPTSVEILLAAYDLFGEFSIITGTMAVYGLNILEGQVFSYQRGEARTTPWGKTEGGCIVDVFAVEYSAARPFDAAAQTAFVTQLTALIQLLRAGKLQQARDTLNHQLVNAISAAPQFLPARLSPVAVQIDNDTSADWTLVQINADDTPGFLYSLSNALAMRNIYIHRVIIDSIQGTVHDQLFVAWRRGGKITSAEGQRELRLIAVLIKQFTHFLTIAPNPAMALQHFDQFLDRLASVAPGEDLHWLWEENTLQGLATMLGSSDFLWEDFLRMQPTTFLPVLKNLHDGIAQRVSKDELVQRLHTALRDATTAAERKHALNVVKDCELFRINTRHLLHPDLPFGLFAEELSDLAEVIVAGALDLAQDTLQARHGLPLLADGTPCAFAVFGLGKLGGRELGYASDLEMLCVYSGAGTTSGPRPIALSEYATMLVQHLRDIIVARRSGTFEIDLRLRPYGSHGPLATSAEAFQEYYRPGGDAAPFERQALIKLRWVAGEAALGQQVTAWRDAYVYSPEPFDLASAVPLRQRQIDELVAPGAIDAKYSRGGLVDVEYTVQYLQLQHGAALPALRTPNTLQALQALHQAGILPDAQAHQLADTYKFLRHLIDALRVVRGNAQDSVLPAPASDEFTFLARRMGYWHEHGTPTQLAHDSAWHMQQAAQMYHERFVRQRFAQ
jgi:glutamate-ammonia-ligase adenylyltransferase